MSEQQRVDRPTGKTNFRYVIFTLVVAMAIINYIDRGAMSYGAQQITQEFGFDKPAWGAVLGYFGYGYMFGALIGGWTADTFGPRKVWIWAATAWSILEIAAAYAGEIGIALFGGSALAGFAVVRILFGFAEGPAYSTINRTMADWAAPKERGFAVALGLLSTPLGALLTAPVAVGLLLLTGSWRWLFIILGVLGLLCLIAFAILFRNKPEEHPRVGEEELALIRSRDEKGPEQIVVEGAKPVPASTFFRSRTLLLNSIGYFAFMFVNFTILTWTPKYLQDEFGFSLSSLWYLGMIPWILPCITILLGGRVSDYIRKRTQSLWKARSLLAVVSMAATAASFLFIPMLSDPVAIIAMMSIGNGLNSFANSVFWAVIIDTAPSRAGTFGGFTHFIANIAAVLAPTLAGILAAQYGYNSIFVAAGVATLVGMVAMFFVKPGYLARGFEAPAREVPA